MIRVVASIALLSLRRMTKFDIRNYFEKIYGIKVTKVNTRIQLGEITDLISVLEQWGMKLIIIAQ